ncbi:MAG: hypothetical protein HC933_12425 [Pleurocapsa sp. SU_196_0]|nr:hypothetical protein [Pleurocapsa sp. SU_196_0]
MPDVNGSSETLQVRAAMRTTLEFTDSPLEGFVTNRIAPFFDRLETDEHPLEVLRDLYFAGVHDSSVTLMEVCRE